jgi:hypothetical protein
MIAYFLAFINLPDEAPLSDGKCGDESKPWPVAFIGEFVFYLVTLYCRRAMYVTSYPVLRIHDILV